MKTVGAIIFFGGLLAFLGLFISLGVRKQPPDLTVPLGDGELQVLVSELGWVYLTKTAQGKNSKRWEADPTNLPELTDILREAGVSDTQAHPLVERIQEIEPRRSRVAPRVSALAVAGVALGLLSWGAAMAKNSPAAWVLFATGSALVALAIMIHRHQTKS